MSEPFVVIDGMLEIIERDLEKHIALLERAKLSLLSFRQARSHEIKRKKVWKNHIGGGKYNDKALEKSMGEIATNIRHMSDKCDLAEKEIKHHQLIVDTLTEQVIEQKDLLAKAAQYYKDHPEEVKDGSER